MRAKQSQSLPPVPLDNVVAFPGDYISFRPAEKPEPISIDAYLMAGIADPIVGHTSECFIIANRQSDGSIQVVWRIYKEQGAGW